MLSTNTGDNDAKIGRGGRELLPDRAGPTSQNGKQIPIRRRSCVTQRSNPPRARQADGKNWSVEFTLSRRVISSWNFFGPKVY